MSAYELTDDEKELMRYVSEGDVSNVRRILSDPKPSVNCCDEQGMTPLQHAAFKGKYEICKLLLDCGANVNDDHHVYGYSALCLAAISNHCDIVHLLLDHGADTTAVNSNNRTASQMAAFVGSHKAVSLINNYAPESIVEYFTVVHGLEKEPKLPVFLTKPLHQLIILPNIHPVRLVLYFQSCSLILQNAKKVIDVLNILSEKQLKEKFNERFSLKFHHIGFVLSSVFEIVNNQSKMKEEQSDEKVLELLTKSWIKDSSENGISLALEKFLRKDISAYPFHDSLLFQQVLSTISATELGNEPNALNVLNNLINGQHAAWDMECCATCGERGAEKKCSACKGVQYCNKTCQKLHWFIHKSACKELTASNT